MKRGVMLPVGPNKEKSQHPWCGSSHRPNALCAVIGLLFITTVLQPQHLALSQQAPSASLDAPARSQDIVAHLNSVIQFYRASTQPIQKAGEPNDVVYRDQAVDLSAQIASFAFQSAKAEATMMPGRVASQATMPASAASDQQQRIQSTEDTIENQIRALQARQADLEKQISVAKPQALKALQAERQQVQGALDLSSAMKDAMQKIVNMSDSPGSSGLTGDIDRLQHSVPELQSNNKIAAPQLTMLDSALNSGVTSQGSVLFQLFETRRSLDTLLENNDELHKQALALRAPISTLLRALIQQGQQLSQQAAGPAAPTSSATAPSGTATAPGSSQPAPLSIQSISSQFKALSAAAVPLSQEMILLEQSRANLAAWQSTVDREYKSVLHALLLRVLIIATALALIIGLGELWSHFTNKYIREIRRRRQFLIVRRVVVGFLSVNVLLFGFVTQFNSLATFAGFITAGIAVGLQTILLSVAAYFFIIGRYGVKVGDRITISSVTGDVIDVGLVRFYIMELAGSGTDLNPTGRVAVFSNAVLFQAGTPLYKQMPGTEYAWHELIVKLTDSANYKLVCERVMKEVHGVYEGYRTTIEQQHQSVENWMQTPIDPPQVASRLQFNSGAFQLWTRFPVNIRQASEIDERITQAIFDLMANNPDIKSAIASTPLVQASVRG